jgi:hypothetical protein
MSKNIKSKNNQNITKKIQTKLPHQLTEMYTSGNDHWQLKAALTNIQKNR